MKAITQGELDELLKGNYTEQGIKEAIAYANSEIKEWQGFKKICIELLKGKEIGK